ncbi:MAG: tryptophan-rich sensory protein [Microgenomates group bacterium Gr01-1014_5]|nr:MAG: tryptophan-rich sensory protein [Microgenomates group bacterium Gr01-1014_5]
MKKINIPLLIFCVCICASAGIVGSIVTFNSVTTWYPTLIKPFFNPPSWIFGPVWTMLYFLMGISLYLVWRKKKADLQWFWIQLVLNALWSIIFFGLKNPLLAFVVIILLWVSIFLTIKSFQKVNKTAAVLLFPYLAWVSFASLLNLFIVVLNR